MVIEDIKYNHYYKYGGILVRTHEAPDGMPMMLPFSPGEDLGEGPGKAMEITYEDLSSLVHIGPATFSETNMIPPLQYKDAGIQVLQPVASGQSLKRELLPCPFCGSISIQQTVRTHGGHGDSGCEVYVLCSGCQAKGPDTGNWGSPSDQQRTEAIDKWNKRTINATSR